MKPRTHRVESVAGRGRRVSSQKADVVWRMTRTVGACGRNRAAQASRISALSRNSVGRFPIHFRVNHFAAFEEWGRNTSSFSKHRTLTSHRGETEGASQAAGFLSISLLMQLVFSPLDCCVTESTRE